MKTNFTSRASVEKSKIQAAFVSNGWKSGTGDDIGAYVERCLYWPRSPNGTAIYIALSEDDPNENPRVEVFNQEEAEVVMTEELTINPASVTKIMNVLKRYNIRELPNQKAITWLYTGKML